MAVNAQHCHHRAALLQQHTFRLRDVFLAVAIHQHTAWELDDRRPTSQLVLAVVVKGKQGGAGLDTGRLTRELDLQVCLGRNRGPPIFQSHALGAFRRDEGHPQPLDCTAVKITAMHRRLERHRLSLVNEPQVVAVGQRAFWHGHADCDGWFRILPRSAIDVDRHPAGSERSSGRPCLIHPDRITRDRLPFLSLTHDAQIHGPRADVRQRGAVVVGVAGRLLEHGPGAGAETGRILGGALVEMAFPPVLHLRCRGHGRGPAHLHAAPHFVGTKIVHRNP